MSNVKRLVRSKNNRMISGVCGGIGEYFEIDPTIVRLIFVILTISGGSGILIYLIFWLFVPNEGQKHDATQEEILKENAQDLKHQANILSKKIEKADKRYLPGALLIFFGILILLRNLDIVGKSYIFPVLFITLGIYFLFRK